MILENRGHEAGRPPVTVNTGVFPAVSGRGGSLTATSQTIRATNEVLGFLFEMGSKGEVTVTVKSGIQQK